MTGHDGGTHERPFFLDDLHVGRRFTSGTHALAASTAHS
jgi:hypothetical protein